MGLEGNKETISGWQGRQYQRDGKHSFGGSSILESGFYWEEKCEYIDLQSVQVGADQQVVQTASVTL